MIIPFDQYQRYKHASEIINIVREHDKGYTVLEVGANEHKNLEHFLPQDNITYLDIVVPEKLKEDPNYIEGDATAMPLGDNQFDFVIALDVFEHIPQSKRRDFLDELERVSRIGFILAAPFNTEDVSFSEKRVNTYFKTLYGFDYPWLEEHVVNGLPDKDETLEYVKNKGWNYFNFSHGSLEVWEKMTKAHFLAAGREKLYDFRFTLDDFYNNYIFENDYNEPCYRTFFFVTNQSEMLKKVESAIVIRRNKLDRSVVSRLDDQIQDLINLSDFQLINLELAHKNILIEQKGDLITNKEKELESYKLELDQLKASIEQQESMNEQMKQELIQSELQLREAEQNFVELEHQLQMNTLHIEELELQLVDKIKLVNDLNILHHELQHNYNQCGVVQHESTILIEQLKADIDLLNITIEGQQEHILKLENVAQQLRIKNRLKKVIPSKLRSLIRKCLYIFRIIKDNPSLVRKGISEAKHNGIQSAINKAQSKIVSTEATVAYTVEENSMEIERIKSEISRFHTKPLISIIVPVYNVEPKWIERAIQSVEEQYYESWELCLVDDCSTNEQTKAFLNKIDHPKIKIRFLDSNNGISEASNEAVRLSDGKYIALLDNDDELTKDALFEVVKAINETAADIVYSDEDKINIHGNRRFPFHKPDWSPDLLRSQMYICHLLVFKRELFDYIGGFRKQFDGSQDYDLMLRLSENAKYIHHIPKVLYSWRELETSTALNPHSKPYAHHAGLKALNEHLVRVFGEGNAYAEETEYLFVYDSRYKVDSVRASIIIPTKDKIDLLEPCVNSILEKTAYSDYEVIIVNNNSVEDQTFKWFEDQSNNPKIKVIDANYEFNWSKLNNHGIREATGEVFVLLNNDTVIIEKDWLQRLVEKANRDDVGTVGGLLLYEDHTIQHAGVVIGLGGWADHIFKGMQPIHYGSPFVSPMLTRNVIASTGACLAISRKTINKIGNFDEKFIICGSDVEISLRALKNDLNNIYDPYVVLHHLESKSRDSYIPPIDFEMSKLHYGPFLEKGDPYFNCNLDLNSLKPTIRQGV